MHYIEQYVINKVAEVTREKKVSAKQLGQIIGTGGSFIANIESKKTAAKYNLKHIYLIAKHFGLSPKDFVPD